MARPIVAVWRRGAVFLILMTSALSACAADPARDVRSALDDVLGDAPVRAALDDVLCGLPALPCTGRLTEVWADVRAFYAAPSHALVWVDHHGPRPAARDAIEALARAEAHGLLPAGYGAATLSTSHTRLIAAATPDARGAPADLAAFEMQVTAALLALGRDVAVGRSALDAPDARKGRGRQAPDLPATLRRLVEAQRLSEWPGHVQPVHDGYRALARALEDVRRESVDAPGHADRIRIISANLARWRALPDDLGTRHVWINIPAFQLAVRDGVRTVLEFPVIVGHARTRTPIFSAELSSIVFSPTWTIPDSIAQGETVPAILRDPAYLARNNMDVLRRVGGVLEPVSVDRIDWRDPASMRGLVIRQRPGVGNALGHVKFVLPNPDGIFLHDTPGHDLFARPGRALSHGCVRLSQPEALAALLLDGDAAWPRDAIAAAMRSEIEREARLSHPVPVHTVYFTAEVDASGRLQVLHDIYGYDK